MVVATTADRSLRLRDTPEALIVEADLPMVAGGEDYGALGLVRRGTVKGISPEFYARRAHTDAGLRVITEADLPVPSGWWTSGATRRRWSCAPGRSCRP